MAIAFAREGADVVVSCLEAEESDARETVRLVEEAGRRGVVATGDITSEDHCQALVDLTVRELGGLDILVNNAAFQMVQTGGIADITTEQFDRVLRTNLYALFWLCKKSVAVMEPGSTIVNTSSIQGMNPSPGLLDYATTKAGIIDFTKGLAADVAKRGIRVNAVAPGPIWTPLIPRDNARRRLSAVRGTTCLWAGPASRPNWHPRTYSSHRTNPATSPEKCSASPAGRPSPEHRVGDGDPARSLLFAGGDDGVEVGGDVLLGASFVDTQSGEHSDPVLDLEQGQQDVLGSDVVVP